MSAAPNKVIGIILKGYPRLSETFIINEILRLEELGYHLHLFAMRNPGEAKVHENVRRVSAPVTYIPDYFWRYFFAFLLANFRVWRSRPRLYWQACRFALVRSFCRRSVSTLKRFLQAAYLIERGLPGTGVAHLHAHFSHGPTTVAYFTSWLTKISYSFSAHAKDIYLQEHDFLRQKIWWAKFVVTCTDFNRDYLLRAAGNDAAIFRSYHGIDLQLFQPASAEPQPQRRPIILSIGRLVPKKGFPILLHALQQLKQQSPFRCYIIGSGPMQRVLEELCDRLDLRHCVEILAPMSQTEVLSYYRQADLFALACEVQQDGDRDGIPNVLVEAMVMGIPVVSTAISGIPELIKHGVNGWLVPEKDPAALAQAIIKLLADPALARRLTAAGRAKVQHDFDARRNVEKIGRLLQTALNTPASWPMGFGAAGTRVQDQRSLKASRMTHVAVTESGGA
jgi:glycosyltransferase involved in cell wall biosynthesis